ncbi:MAG TPA: nucleoside phosphorylase [Methylomirabilota bacterium]|nr:nucleoside phosphorylase [Methylomirabilota bacterium]
MNLHEFPILEFDDNSEAIIEPVPYKKVKNIPQHAVICYFKDVIDDLLQAKKIVSIQTEEPGLNLHPINVAALQPIYLFKTKNAPIVVFFPGIGAPVAAATFEEVIALGCRKFICCGSAGLLDKDIAKGHILIPTSAVRDEGTSYHYLRPTREVEASPEGILALEDTLRLHNYKYLLTKTWTIDAIYRETLSKRQLRKSEQCLTVEMEAAALFAVAQFRKVIVAQVLYGSDDISGNTWDVLEVERKQIRETLFWLAVEACLRL